MSSEAEETAWRPSTDAEALSNLRSLIRSYIRGELSHSAFVMQFGVMCLTHDVATPQSPDHFVRTEDIDDPWLPTYPDGTTTDISTHPDGCGCDWHNQDMIGRYRGHVPEDGGPAGSKAEE